MSTDTKSPRTIFLDALEHDDPNQRNQFLDAACGADDDLRREVDRLLAANRDLNSFMGRPAAAGLAATVNLPAAEQIGATIGRYKLLEQIGEGGMGIVYVAEQTEPVRRRVALKIIKPGMDTRQVIARFEAERQALAMMDHPNIAKVLDGGTTDEEVRNSEFGVRNETPLPPGEGRERATPHSALRAPHSLGRPYFVMELVRGMPITDYCDQARLNPRGRLELFITVCHAVQHAHQKGIIHRDLKPSNVLVTLHDGQPVVKVIDFGVAKAINQQLTERTIYTAHTELIGTPLYMSPEQAELSGLDIDTRSDVYSLGVLLYELLTGHTPFDRDTLVKAGLDEVRRMIREDEPPRPSHRISTLKADAGSTVSQKRGIDHRQLTRLLHGELDWITMKALEKDRNRRYESASAFARDIQCYLNDEPVVASPHSVLYRFRKFVRRNRAVVTSTLVLLILATLGLATSTILILEERNAAIAAHEESNGHYQVARKAVDRLLTSVSEEKLLYEPHMEGLRLDLLSGALEFYEDLAKQSTGGGVSLLETARAKERLGNIYGALNRRQDAYDAHRQATEALRELWRESPDDVQVGTALARALLSLSRARQPLGFVSRIDSSTTPDSYQNCQEAITVLEDLIGQRPATRELSTVLADAHWAATSHAKTKDESRPHYEKAKSIFEDLMADEAASDADRFNLASLIAQMHLDVGPSKVPFKALAMLEKVVERNPTNAKYRARLAQNLWNYAIRLEEGSEEHTVDLLSQSVRLFEELVVEYPSVPGYRTDLAMAQMNLAVQYGRLKELGNATQLSKRAEETLERLQKEYPHHLDYGNILTRVRDNLAGLHFQRREYRQLVETQLKVIEQDRMRSEKGIGVGMNHWNTGARYFKLARQMAEIGDFEPALKFARQGHEAWVQFKKVGELGSFNDQEDKTYHHYDEMRQAYGAVAERFYRSGRHADSAEFARHYIDVCRAWATDKPDYDFALVSLPQAYLRPPYDEFGAPDEALRLIDAALAAHEKKPTGSGIRGEVWRLRGKAHFRLGNWEESIAAMHKSIETRSGTKETHEWPAGAIEWFTLAMDHWHLGNRDEARTWYDKGVAWMNDKKNDEIDRLNSGLELRELQAETEELMRIRQLQSDGKQVP